MNEAFTGPLAGVLGGIGVVLIKWLLDRRPANATVEKTEAEAGLTIDQRWKRWSENLEERLAEAEKKVSALTDRVTDLERSLSVSEAQVTSLTRLLRSVVRWALTLKDELLKAGGIVPPMPSDVEVALTTLEPGEKP